MAIDDLTSSDLTPASPEIGAPDVKQLGIAEQQSFLYDIRDAMYNIIAVHPHFAGWKIQKTKMLQVQPDALPYLGIYVIEEIMLPDGDGNIGCVRFSHTGRIGFSIIQAHNDPNVVERMVDASYWKIMGLLWTNAHLMNVLKNSNPEGVGIESSIRGSRKPTFGSTGLNNETPFAEMQYEVSCFYRSEWYPDITDTLNEIDVTVPVNNSDPSQVQPITVKYMFDALRAARRG